MSISYVDIVDAQESALRDDTNIDRIELTESDIRSLTRDLTTTGSIEDDENLISSVNEITIVEGQESVAITEDGDGIQL